MAYDQHLADAEARAAKFESLLAHANATSRRRGAERDSARAELERLRAALSHISALCQMEGGELAHTIWHEAEEALTPSAWGDS
jgi:hypothetical protein